MTGRVSTSDNEKCLEEDDGGRPSFDFLVKSASDKANSIRSLAKQKKKRQQQGLSFSESNNNNNNNNGDDGEESRTTSPEANMDGRSKEDLITYVTTTETTTETITETITETRRASSPSSLPIQIPGADLNNTASSIKSSWDDLVLAASGSHEFPISPPKLHHHGKDGTGSSGGSSSTMKRTPSLLERRRLRAVAIKKKEDEEILEIAKRLERSTRLRSENEDERHETSSSLSSSPRFRAGSFGEAPGFNVAPLQVFKVPDTLTTQAISANYTIFVSQRPETAEVDAVRSVVEGITTSTSSSTTPLHFCGVSSALAVSVIEACRRRERDAGLALIAGGGGGKSVSESHVTIGTYVDLVLLFLFSFFSFFFFFFFSFFLFFPPCFFFKMCVHVSLLLLLLTCVVENQCLFCNILFETFQMSEISSCNE